VRVGSTAIAIFNTGAGFLAVENRCPHGGGPLADGIVGGSTVTCPLHNWRICLESGQVQRPCETAEPAVRTFRTKVEDGIVMLAAEDLRATCKAA
jgi:nitrite reductase (NADH) small subunit